MMNEFIREQTREQFTQMLRNTNRDNIDALVWAMIEGGFFKAPCSTQFHLCEPGGLCLHSLNVCLEALKLVDIWCPKADKEFRNSVIICALLHDLGKMGDHGKANYIDAPPLKSGKAPAKPYITNPELYAEEHEIRSVLIAERFITLSEEEEGAILHHNGLYGKLDSAFGAHGYDRDMLAFIIHTADMVCCRFLEGKTDASDES